MGRRGARCGDQGGVTRENERHSAFPRYCSLNVNRCTAGAQSSRPCRMRQRAHPLSVARDRPVPDHIARLDAALERRATSVSRAAVRFAEGRRAGRFDLHSRRITAAGRASVHAKRTRGGEITASAGHTYIDAARAGAGRLCSALMFAPRTSAYRRDRQLARSFRKPHPLCQIGVGAQSFLHESVHLIRPDVDQLESALGRQFLHLCIGVERVPQIGDAFARIRWR